MKDIIKSKSTWIVLSLITIIIVLFIIIRKDSINKPKEINYLENLIFELVGNDI